MRGRLRNRRTRTHSLQIGRRKSVLPFDSITVLKFWSVRSVEHLLPTFKSSATQHLRKTHSAGPYPKVKTTNTRIRLQHFMICESASSN